ncbi:hypothetical protein A2U01_0060920, partial [Trifolium medium]|nr:hypothetical protein [Trifolium medium]
NSKMYDFPVITDDGGKPGCLHRICCLVPFCFTPPPPMSDEEDHANAMMATAAAAPTSHG